MRDPIHDHVADLLAGLRVGGARRRRIAREALAHLTEAAEDERRRGASPQEAADRAVARFGDARALAAEFNADAARHALNRAAWALVACATVAAGAAGLALHGAVPARPWPSGPAFYALPELLTPVAFVAAVNGLVLAVVAPWLRGAAVAGRAAVLAGRSLATAALALVPVGVVAGGNVGASMPLIGRLPLAALAAGVPLAAYGGLRAAHRASWLAHDGGGDRGRGDRADTLDVIAATCHALAARSAYAQRAVGLAGRAWCAARRRAPRLTRWADLRRHPWRAAATASVAAGFAMKTPDLLVGDPDLLGAAIETAAAFTGFAALGGLLGLRGHGPAPSAEPLPAESVAR